MCLLIACLPAAAEGARADAARIDALLAEGERLASSLVHRADLAVTVCREAQRLAERAGDPIRAARAAVALGTAFYHMDRLPEAEAALASGVRAATRAGDTTLEANALRQLGAIYIGQARYDAATDMLERALALGRKIGDAEVVATSLSNLSASAVRRGRFPDAVRHGQLASAEVDRAIAQGKTLPAPILFQAPFNYAKGLAGLGDYIAAAPLFERAFAAAERTNNLGGQHHILFDTAEWYQAQGDLDRAGRYYQRALEQSRLILDSRITEAKSWCGLGSIAAGQDAYARAVDLYGHCVSIYESIHYTGQVPEALASLARAQSMAGQTAEARRTVDRALTLARATDSTTGLVTAELERARQSLADGAWADARLDYRAAGELARMHKILPLEPAALVGLAAVARAEGELVGAAPGLRASVAAVERIRGRIVSIDQRAAFAEAAHTTFSALVTVLAEQHRRDPRAGHDREAFDAVEQERTRNVSAALSDDAPRRADAATSEERALDQRLAETQTELASPDTIAPRRVVLVATLDDLERQLDAANAKGPSATRAREEEGLPDLDALQRVLGADEAFVEYVLAEGAAFAFLVGREDFALVPLTLPAGFRDRVRVFGRLLASPDGRDAEAAGRVLSDALLPALLARAGSRARTLIIAVAGDAATLPFAALPDPRRHDAAVPLLQRFDVAYVPSLAVLHFAAHTVLDAQVPARSAIALASPDPGVEDGLLQGREIYGMRLAADLVVLSACRSAAGRGSSAEGLHSLARAFLYAGARSILGTSWDVDDRPAAALVKRVYDGVAQGDTIGAALAGAQRAAGGNAPYARSAQWAAFVVVGDPAAKPDLQWPPWWVRSPVAAWTAVISGSVALAILAAVSLRRRFGTA